MQLPTSPPNLAGYRVLISRCVIGFCLLFLLIRGMEHLLPTQLLQPPLPRAAYNFTEWFFKLSGLAYWLIQNKGGAFLFTLALALSGVFSFFFPLERKFTITFSLLYFLYTLCFTTYLTFSTHLTHAVVWSLFVLWPRRAADFGLVWQGFRYYACWPFASTFVLKLINGAFWQWDFGLWATKANLTPYLFYFPDTTWAKIYYWLLAHPFLLNAGAKIFMLAQAFFIAGYFTRKYDKVLLFLYFFIFIQTYFFADVFFGEILVLCFAFFPEAWWRRLWLATTPAAVHNLFASSEN